MTSRLSLYVFSALLAACALFVVTSSASLPENVAIHFDAKNGADTWVTRDQLTEAEVERLMKAASDNRYGHRDSTMLLLAFRHGLRASELVDLRWLA